MPRVWWSRSINREAAGARTGRWSQRLVVHQKGAWMTNEEEEEEEEQEEEGEEEEQGRQGQQQKISADYSAGGSWMLVKKNQWGLWGWGIYTGILVIRSSCETKWEEMAWLHSHFRAFSRRFCPKRLAVIHRGNGCHARCHPAHQEQLGFSILPKDTWACRPWEWEPVTSW